ncbi:helix-turn-helix transcriptional regulator [Kribbella turkmenica]|uniref:Helix-turn-helix transcriptional regulator n=1 Tax=Kribbella turkmenica TaxID=2530375 RepID=A0A4R4WVQ3_9ACTN|nr:LuxR family transcriptional regulator [Kribbella turkmenica]TDD21770.1 helix-turn-helix transcriptional regulator [Kribbella turkmenica]
MAPRHSTPGLIGRRNECLALDGLLEGVRSGRSAALVLRGEAGIGKTELLKYLLERSSRCRIVRAAGVQSEMELSYAGLHQLCAPLITGLDHLPGPQQEALESAFGLRAGIAPDRFLVGLAVLSLLADAGGGEPLVCLIDDAQWLDQASAMTLEFVARRLFAESVLLVFAVREPTPEKLLGGLPELLVDGLRERDSRTLLDSVVTGPLDPRVRDRIVVESRGNPLALLELPRGWAAAELAGGFGESEARPLSSQIEGEFVRRIESLRPDTRRLLITAAADPVGDVLLLRRAAERLGVDVDRAAADASELMSLGAGVRFRHPLVRSAVYRVATLTERQDAHRALAESIDAQVDPDRRAWHRAQAAPGPDEDVALELEQSAERAQARGGIAAMAAFLERAVGLTQDPARRSQRALDAAQAKFQAGAFEPAAALLATATAGTTDELMRARIDGLHAGIAFAQGRGREVPPLLLAAARRLEQFDAALARGTYLEAVSAVIFAGHLARSPGYREVGQAALGAPPVEVPRVTDELLDALAVRLTDGHAASVPLIERVLTAFSTENVPVQEAMHWLLLAGVIAADLWDLERWDTVTARHVTIIRAAGALSELPLALDSSAVVHVFAGDLATASSLVEEVRTVSAAIGSNQPPFGALALAAVRGREHEARALIEATVSEASQYGQGLGVTVAHYHRAVLCNGLAQYEEAVAAAQEAASHQEEFGAPQWALAELVEAAVRSGAADLASGALERLSEATQACGTDWALGVEARSRALLSEGATADALYREAIERLSRTRVRVNLARAHLLYGEWLRHEHRNGDAGTQLDLAHEMLTQIGADAYAERARRQLEAGGTKTRRRTTATSTELTAQEAQIARLAAGGLTNPEIGARLFLSPHTIEWHLRKVFSKLGITSRRQIPTTLPQSAASA